MSFTGGASQVVSDVFNLLWDMAQSRTLEAQNQSRTAIQVADAWRPVNVPTVSANLSLPQKPDIGLDPTEAVREYDSIRQALEASFGGKLEEFLDLYFPQQATYSKAMDWLDRSLDGGTGIDPAIERQIWERERTRTLNEVARTESDAAATWANRGFSMPPGMLTGQMQQIRLDAQRRLSEQSREIAVKSYDTGVENARLAVRLVLDSAQTALNAANEYIKTLMLGPQLASELALSQVDARVKLAQSLTSLYAAEVSAADPAVRLAIAQGDLTMRGVEADSRAATAALESRVRAALAYAEMLGAQAAAGLNALNASASISGQDSTVRNIDTVD